MTGREFRLRRRIDQLRRERDIARVTSDQARARARKAEQVRGDHCVYCGAPARAKVCWAHSDLMGEAA